MLTSNRSQLWGKNDYCFGRCYQSSYRHCGLCHRGRCHPCARGGRLCESGGTLARGRAGFHPCRSSTVAPCDPAVDVCIPQVGLPLLVTQTAPNHCRTPSFWFGSPANPDFQPLVGIVFPNFFGLDFEACFLGAAVHLSPYSRRIHWPRPRLLVSSDATGQLVRRLELVLSSGSHNRGADLARVRKTL